MDPLELEERLCPSRFHEDMISTFKRRGYSIVYISSELSEDYPGLGAVSAFFGKDDPRNVSTAVSFSVNSTETSKAITTVLGLNSILFAVQKSGHDSKLLVCGSDFLVFSELFSGLETSSVSHIQKLPPIDYYESLVSKVKAEIFTHVTVQRQEISTFPTDPIVFNTSQNCATEMAKDTLALALLPQSSIQAVSLNH